MNLAEFSISPDVALNAEVIRRADIAQKLTRANSLIQHWEAVNVHGDMQGRLALTRAGMPKELIDFDKDYSLEDISDMARTGVDDLHGAILEASEHNNVTVKSI